MMSEEIVQYCIPCHASTHTPVQNELLHLTPLPPASLTEIDRDVSGTFMVGDYLPVAIDEYSRFTDVESTSAKVFISGLNSFSA